MAQTQLTDQNVLEAGIAASLAAHPELLPEPSVYFQDFNFGKTMWDAAFGNVDGGSVSGVGEAVADIAIDNKMQLEEKRRKEDDPAKDADLIVQAGKDSREALARMQARSNELSREIADWESQFEEQFGDAWRETIANEILDPDQIPERRDGESMDAYRARLEAILVAEMIDANGNIKPEYADSPYARWAQAEYEKHEVDGWIDRRTDPRITPTEADRMDREVVENETFNTVQQSDTELVSQGTESDTLASGTDSHRDDVDDRVASTVAQASDFLTMTPS
ncbi:MAG: hypothetical protein Pars2KO_32140 [Parasphingorhabdus sp.]